MNLQQTNPKIITKEPITKQYYNEIRHYEPLSYDEERILLEMAKNGDILARNRIIESQLKFVVTMARRAKTNININDLINEGNIGLINAIENFDLSKRERFSSYAVHWINKAINEYIINNEKIVRIKNANRVYSYVNKYRNMYFKEYERWPADDELREYMSIKGVEFPKTQIFNTIIASIDSINNENDDNTANEIIKEAEIASSNNNIINYLYNSDDKRIVKDLLTECTDEERDIITMMYGIGRNEETIASIASIKKMQPMKVKRVAKKAIEKMKLKKIK